MTSQPGDRDTFSLRSMQHRDREGKVISMSSTFKGLDKERRSSNTIPDDPDLSNPTRSRLERPLDTIRSFEAAIEAHRKQNRM